MLHSIIAINIRINIKPEYFVNRLFSNILQHISIDLTFRLAYAKYKNPTLI